MRRTHGLSRTRVYHIWNQMRQRCNNPTCPSYPGYGGRGITVCAIWNESFEAFVADMGPGNKGLSLDRIDNDAGYFPENCRWATTEQQALNRRNNRRISFGGSAYTPQELATLLHIPRARLFRQCVVKGLSVEQVLDRKDWHPGRRASSDLQGIV